MHFVRAVVEAVHTRAGRLTAAIGQFHLNFLQQPARVGGGHCEREGMLGESGEVGLR